MRTTRGRPASPLHTPQLWQFWSAAGKSGADAPAPAPQLSPPPPPPPPPPPAAASPPAAAADAVTAAGASSPSADAGRASHSPPASASRGSSRQHRRLWSSLARRSVEELQARYLALTQFETTESEHAALLQAVFDLAVQAGELSPEQATPTPAPTSPDQQEPLSGLRGEPAPPQRTGDWRMTARVPRYLGAGPKGTPVAMMGLAGGAGGPATVPAGITAADDATDAPANAPAAPPALVWDVCDDEAVWRAKECLNTAATVSSSATRCRDDERSRVLSFCRERLQAGLPGSMYVSGVPGTGKSLTLRELEAAAHTWGDPPPLVASVNCMGLPDAREVFVRIIAALGGEVPAASTASAGAAQAVDDLPEVAALRRLITQPAPQNRKRKLGAAEPPGDENAGGVWALILLDEMDALLSRAQGVLYELFALPTLRGARCVLVGAANTMNLTDRLLPRLRARDCEPSLASFPAYTVAQLGELLRARLATLPWRVFEDGALDLCARRVAASSGDMRRALHAACAAIDAARDEAVAAAAGEDVDGALPAPPAKGLVRIGHMSNALSQIFKQPVEETIRALPRHHQLTLCTAVLLLRGSERKDTTLGELNDAYTDLCRRHSLRALSVMDFSSMCSALADDALISCGDRRGEDRKRRIALCVNEEHVVSALQAASHFFERMFQ